jgi:hypothetical protein
METSSRRRTPAKKIVGTSPSTSDGLTFTLVPHNDSVSPLLLTNRCNKSIAFKVKTNNTERYLVQPNQGVIAVGGKAEIKIFCLSKNVNSILHQSFHQMEEYEGKDKFLLQTRTIDASKMNELMATAGTEGDMAKVAEELSQLFAKTPETKSKIQSHKFGVHFDSDHWKQAVTEPVAEEAAAPAAAPPAADEGQGGDEEGAPAPAPVEDAPAKSAQPAPASESRAEMVEKEDAGGSAQATSAAPAIIQNSESSKSASGSYNSNNMDKMEKDFAQLRKKYDELLKWTLQLTGDRDKLQKMTDKLTQENTKLRLSIDTKRTGNLEKYRQSADDEETSAAQKKLDDEYAAKVKKLESQQKNSSGFSLFSVLLVAVFAFAIGRVLDLLQNNQSGLAR